MATNLERLIWGMKHIAENHGFSAKADMESILEDGEVYIFGGSNVPTIADVNFLCENVGIDKSNVESNDFGIDVWIPSDWLQKKANEPYTTPEFMEFWRRRV